MLPLKLKMSAFCSYLEETEIDFTKFGKKGLYLITGDTGAGKTTIFDAICYALYKEASGDLRDPKLFRSKNAPPDIPTYVELTFISKGKKYTVRRSPEYERASKRGDKTTVSKAEAFITYYNGDDTKTEALRKSDTVIEDIIGIDVKRFKQLSMIAQGAFMRVLNADTAEKTEILRAIFNTEKFGLMQEELKVLSDKCREKYELESRRLIAEIQRSSCDEKSSFGDELSRLKETNSSFVTGTDKISELLLNIIAEDNEKLSVLMGEAKKSDELIGVRQTEIGKAKERENTRKIYLDTKNKLQDAEKQLPSLEAAFNAVEKNETAASAIDGEIKLLNEKLSDYRRLEELNKLLCDTEGSIKRMSGDIKQREALHNNLREKISDLRKELESYKDSAAALEKIKAENARKNEIIDKYRGYLREIKSYESSIKNRDELQKKYTETKNEYLQKNRLYMEMNNAFLDEQAGIIAETLVEGRPCPVCGSSEHPRIAKKRPDAPTKEQVNNARKNAEEASELASRASSACSSAGTVCDQKKEAADRISEELFGEIRASAQISAALVELGVSLKNEIEKGSAEITALNNQCKRKADIEKELPTLEKAAEEARTALEKLNTDIAVAQQKKTGISQQISETKASLPYPTEALMKQKIVELTTRRQALATAFKEAEKKLSECRTTIREKKETLSGFGDISLKDEHEEIEKAENEVMLLKNENVLRGEKANNLRMRISSNTGIYEYINKNSPLLTQLHDYYTELNELNLTANGRLTGGREKMTLEVFAQTKYFDSILSFANLRLRKMSNGKYEFKRSENALEKRAKSGLDIDVIDHDSATRRSVRSLSGGESFMASLSLALGFSDVIQSNVGGVHLETMFIDEGFGTLDDKALENAYRVFTDLSSDGSCLVGIISHVEDLKSRITNRIVVTKDSLGNSHAKIETELQ